MELLYLWSENFRNLKKVGFNFSEQFHVTFEEDKVKKQKVLKISENHDNNFSFFGRNISSVTAIVGENGSGKTNILDLLGLNYKDRMRACVNLEETSQTYFTLYHLVDELYVIEGIGLDLIKDIVKDIPLDSGIKNCYSFILKLIEGKLYFEGFYESYNRNHNNLAYLNIRSNFRNGYDKSSFIEEIPTFNFSRININPRIIGFLQKYKLLLFLKNQEKRMPDEKLINYNSDIFINIQVLEGNYDDELQLEEIDDSLLSKAKVLGRTKEISNREYFTQRLLYNYMYKVYNEVMESYEYDKYGDKRLRKLDIEETILEAKLEKQDLRKYYLNLLEIICEFDQVDINTSDCIKELLSKLDVIDDRYFTESGIEVRIETTEDESISELLQCLDKGEFYETLRLELQPTSAGEEALINLLASIYDGIHKLEASACKRVILLLDEPDSFMHPEWSRRMMSMLLNYLNYYVGGYYIYQLIISTHSPFIISDIPKRSIIALEKEQKTSNCIVKGNEFIGETFAGNIHTLLSEEFFMKSTIGEFAKLKISKAIKDLNNIPKDNFENSKRREIEFLIKTIGEPILKKKLKSLYEEKFNHDADLKDKYIEELKQQVELLKNHRELGVMIEAIERKVQELKEQVGKI